MVNKVFVSQMGYGPNPTNIGYLGIFVDVANASVETYPGVLEVGTDLITFDPEEIRAAIEAQLLAYAVSQSYSVTADDFVWAAPVLMSLLEIKANRGIVSSIIDGKTVGNTTLLANNSGKSFLVTEYWIVPTTITGLGTAPVINIGKTASAYNDIDSSVGLGFANNVGKYSRKEPNANAVLVANGESLIARVATAAILTTAYSFKVLIRGVYF